MVQAPERDQEHSIRHQLAALNVGTVGRLQSNPDTAHAV
jgi:hypothetical protein